MIELHVEFACYFPGDPIVNTVTECLKMLDELPDLDYVVIEDYLFKAPMIKKTPEPKESFRRHAVKILEEDEPKKI